MRLFVFGLGYTALTVSRRLIAEGWMVAGTCRSPEKQEALKAEGIDASIFDTDQPLTSAGEVIGDATHILISLPPGEAGDAALRHHGDNIVRLSNLRWLGYLSTTGVYGDQAGAWVDEATPLVPSTQRGERRVAAEAGWMSLHDHGGVPVHLFRLPGIYGPGRSAIDNVRAGRTRRNFKEGQVFSRIHIDDLASAIIASMKAPNPGAAYNICDDEPAPPQDVTAYAGGLLNVPVDPLMPFEDADLSPMARSFYSESKRVRNNRMKNELGVVLLYPTYREGLRSILAGE